MNFIFFYASDRGVNYSIKYGRNDSLAFARGHVYLKIFTVCFPAGRPSAAGAIFHPAALKWAKNSQPDFFKEL